MLSFQYSSWINAPVDRVWAFHEQEGVLELLSPPGTKILSREGRGLEAGARVEILAPILGPIKVRWLALHVECKRGSLFVDEQVSGPFRYWRHSHHFLPQDGGTRLTDVIRFSLPLAPVSDWLIGWAVKLQLRAMFAKRHKVTRKLCEQ